MNNQEETITSRPAGPAFARAAAIDATERSEAAYNKYQDFFDAPEHAERVEVAYAILDRFFKVKDMYVNMRENRGNPFTVIKVTNHVFPNVPLSVKDKMYRTPLENLGVEIKLPSGTNSYLYYIR